MGERDNGGATKMARRHAKMDVTSIISEQINKPCCAGKCLLDVLNLGIVMNRRSTVHTMVQNERAKWFLAEMSKFARYSTRYGLFAMRPSSEAGIPIIGSCPSA